jgi:hypothetical protein
MLSQKVIFKERQNCDLQVFEPDDPHRGHEANAHAAQ